MSPCAICDNSSVPQQIWGNGASFRYSCPTCGEYFITLQALSLLSFYDNTVKKEHSSKISAYLKNRNILGLIPHIICQDSLSTQTVLFGISFDEIIDQFPKLISDRLDIVILNLAKLSAYSGDFIKISTNDYPLFYAEKNNATQIYIMKQLIDEKLIELKNSALTLPNEVRLAPKGWNKVVELEQRGQKDNNKVFIVMSFDPSLVTAYEQGIVKAISDNGYDPIRVECERHIDEVSDCRIADIRKCKYVVADFTFNCGGIYYEAGFAMGLGKPVIWTCREDHIKNLHFDTRQYNHISWKTDQDLYTKLDARMKAVF